MTPALFCNISLLYILPYLNRMLHKILLFLGRCAGGQVLEQDVQGSGALPERLLADGGGDHALFQHLQGGGHLVKGDDLGDSAGFHDGLAAAVYARGGEE